MAVVLTVVLGACASSGVPAPATLVAGQEACRSCRMAISSTRTAAQIVMPNEEPLFFDDIGCLRDYLRDRHLASASTAVYVVDHRTGIWIPAHNATYVLVAGQDTPMGSHLFAYADKASRDVDLGTAPGQSVNARELFRGIELPGERP